MTLSRPARLTSDHQLIGFNSGRPSLDSWLSNRALKNEEAGASRTYVVCNDNRVVAYYCLATGAVQHAAAPAKIKRNMPDPIPVMLMGRLAVDITMQGKGTGRALLKDAILRTLQAAGIAGLRALLVHAIDEQAAAFYKHNGFLASPIDPLVLMLPLAGLQSHAE